VVGKRDANLSNPKPFTKLFGSPGQAAQNYKSPEFMANPSEVKRDDTSGIKYQIL